MRPRHPLGLAALFLGLALTRPGMRHRILSPRALGRAALLSALLVLARPASPAR